MMRMMSNIIFVVIEEDDEPELLVGNVPLSMVENDEKDVKY